MGDFTVVKLRIACVRCLIVLLMGRMYKDCLIIVTDKCPEAAE